MSNIIKYDFQGNLYSFQVDGWFNATEAAKRYGKEPRDWLRLHETEGYMRALAEALRMPFSPKFVRRKSSGKVTGGKSGFRPELSECAGLVTTKRGSPENGGGTWLHPKLAVVFARWVNVEFSVWCDLQIDAIIRNGIRAESGVSLLPMFLRESAATWELRFPPSYYHALARMTNTRYMGHTTGTPMQYAQITDLWVYGCILPVGVHTELKVRRHQSEKMHQWLTHGGQDILDRQIALVTAIAASSADYADFKARMMAVSGRGGQLGFVFPKAA